MEVAHKLLLLLSHGPFGRPLTTPYAGIHSGVTSKEEKTHRKDDQNERHDYQQTEFRLLGEFFTVSMSNEKALEKVKQYHELIHLIH